jgi:hypothetical protein
MSDEVIDIVFDGPPSHESGRFVEVEAIGKSIRFGQWVQRDDGYHVLRFHVGGELLATKAEVAKLRAELAARDATIVGLRQACTAEPTTVPVAIATIAAAIKSDPGYRISWVANIAMAYVDCERWYKERHGIKRLTRLDKHAVANEAAKHFLKLCFGAEHTESKRKAKKGAAKR